MGDLGRVTEAQEEELDGEVGAESHPKGLEKFEIVKLVAVPNNIHPAQPPLQFEGNKVRDNLKKKPAKRMTSYIFHITPPSSLLAKQK